MNRRDLFKLALLPFVAPYLPKIAHIGRAVAGRAFWQTQHIPMRTMIARIRITEEALADIGPGKTAEFFREDANQTIRDIQAREEAALLGSGRER